MTEQEGIVWPTPPIGIRSVSPFDDATLEQLLGSLKKNDTEDWFELVQSPENPSPLEAQLPDYDHDAELAAVPAELTEEYREQAIEYIGAVIEVREKVRPDSLRPVSELPEGISRFTSRHWVWYRVNDQMGEREDDQPRSLANTTDHGKYLFFTPDETGVLERIVVEQFLDQPFTSAKVPTEPNRRDDAVLCLYYSDDRYRSNLRERYQNEPEDDTYGVASPYDPESPTIMPRGFKTDDATRRNEYSDKYRNSS